MQTPTIAILAGGRSERMGRDKARLVVEGAPLMERTVRVARATESPVLVVGRARPHDWQGDDVPFVEDEEAGAGPLGGLVTALEHAACPILLIACDMPRLYTEALRWLLDEHAKHGDQEAEEGTATRNGAQIEPLFSVYNPACLPLARQRLAEGRRSLHGLIAAGRFAHVEIPTQVAAALVNVNTPDDWAALDP